jgi:hypothetical protein
MEALGFVKKPKLVATDALVQRILSAATTEPIRIEPMEYDTAPMIAAPSAVQAAVPAADAANVAAQEDSVMAGTQDGEEAAVEDTPEDAETAGRAASEALRNIAAGLHAADGAKKASMVQVVETRNFAGQEIKVTTEHHAGSKAAVSAQNREHAAASKSGLDAALANITGVQASSLQHTWVQNSGTSCGARSSISLGSVFVHMYLSRHTCRTHELILKSCLQLL